jgi:hypothetical protein
VSTYPGYQRATCYLLPDPVPSRRELAVELPRAVECLEAVMRDVQMLASKFRCALSLGALHVAGPASISCQELAARTRAIVVGERSRIGIACDSLSSALHDCCCASCMTQVFRDGIHSAGVSLGQ